MRHSTKIRPNLRGRGRGATAIKNMYLHPISTAKQRPMQSLGFLTLGAGILSTFYMLLRGK